MIRLCNYDKSPNHVESAGKFTLNEVYNFAKKNKATDVLNLLYF
jgi:hypothetical protein